MPRVQGLLRGLLRHILKPRYGQPLEREGQGMLWHEAQVLLPVCPWATSELGVGWAPGPMVMPAWRHNGITSPSWSAEAVQPVAERHRAG